MRKVVSKTVYPHLGIIDEVEEVIEEGDAEVKYTLLNQKYGVLDAFEPFTVQDKLQITVDNTVGFPEPMTMKLVNGEGTVFYANIEDGRCEFDEGILASGKIGVCIITTEGTIPCMGLISVRDEEGRLLLLPDASEVLARLSKAEREISSALAAFRAVEGKYNDLKERIEKLFTQNYY
jgi:hypothetical protein